MKKIRASEISAYLYCKRAWWYQQQGISTDNVEELAEGTELHHRHGKAVFISGLIRLVALGLLLAALILFALSLVNLIL